MNSHSFRLPIAVLLVMAMEGSVSPACRAHEFWLEPSNFAPAAGEAIDLRLRNGQFFKGDSYPLVRAWFTRFAVIEAGKERKLAGTEGDDPAIHTSLAVPGMAIFTYQGTPDLLTFEKWEKFEGYLRDEGLADFIARHRERGLRESGITESYIRCAKALVQVGRADGRDQPTGLPFEIVAEANPFTLAQGQPLPVLLLLQGKPVSGLTIKVFNRDDPNQPQRYITDADGRALIPVPRKGAYLLNAVHLMEPGAGAKTDWSSHWASIVFARP